VRASSPSESRLACLYCCCSVPSTSSRGARVRRTCRRNALVVIRRDLPTQTERWHERLSELGRSDLRRNPAVRRFVEDWQPIQAIVQDQYGSPDVLALEDIAQPVIAETDVLVRVHAASVNVADWLTIYGRPYVARPAFGGLRRPKPRIRGKDAAGEVVAVGSAVKRLQPGDHVFGLCNGSFAEYVSAAEDNFQPKPVGLTFEQAAAVPLAAATALRNLRDLGQLRAGQKALINGAAGAWAHSPCRSRSGWERRSPASAAPGMWNWCNRLAPTASSTTHGKTSRPKAGSTTSSSITS
jgi:hypothetical protein